MDIQLNKNEDEFKLLIADVRTKTGQASLGGGKSRLERHRERGKLTARDRIEYLIDKNTEFLEIGALAGYEMYEDQGGCPSGGVVAGIGYVHGKQCMIVANDATVKAGAWFPITVKKNLRAQEIALENRLPVIYLVDSAGAYLPMQNEVFPDKEDFGRIFRNNAQMSAKGIPQIAAVMGSCVAGGAYLPIMSDESLIVEGSGTIFLAGSYLVKAAIGEDIDNQTLGGATTQTEISGVIDHKCENDEKCLDKIRSLMDKIGEYETAGFNKIEVKEPLKKPEEIYGLFPVERMKPYDMKEILERIVDADSYEEYKEDYGKTIICAYARIDGWAVGIVANQRLIVKNAQKEMQMGGVIYSDSADKAARFIMNCNQKKIPLVFFQDVSGFMVGSKSEHGGIIKDGAKMVSAVSNSVVPKFTVVVGNSYGAGNYAMCGKAYDPRLIVAWPTAEIAVMSGAAAAKTLLQIEMASMKDKELTKEEQGERLKAIKEKYDKEISPYYAAARLWVDAIIDPLETRKVLSEGIKAANNAPITEKFNPGVLQT